MKGIEIIELDAYRDERGWNVNPLDEKELRAGVFANLHVVSMEPGTTRGNHIHLRQTERFFVIGGPCLFAARNPETGETFERTFQPGETVRATVAPGIEHAFKNISGAPAYLVCASDVAYDSGNPDSRPVKILE